MKWFKIRELPTTSTRLDQPIFSPFPARPRCPTKTSNDGGPQRERGEKDVILSFQSAPAPVRAHAHTRTHRTEAEVWRVSVWSRRKVAGLQMRKQTEQKRGPPRGLCVRFLLVRKCVVSCSVNQFAGTGVKANEALPVDSLIYRTWANAFTQGPEVPESESRDSELRSRAVKLVFQSKIDLSHRKKTGKRWQITWDILNASLDRVTETWNWNRHVLLLAF